MSLAGRLEDNAAYPINQPPKKLQLIEKKRKKKKKKNGRLPLNPTHNSSKYLSFHKVNGIMAWQRN